jgi:hypothetical protein
MTSADNEKGASYDGEGSGGRKTLESIQDGGWKMAKPRLEKKLLVV